MQLHARTSDIKKTGDFAWKHVTPTARILVIAIPCNRNPDKWVYSRWHCNHKSPNGSQWTWNQDEHKPTLKPSLHAVGVWHGFVRDGMLIEA